jgi:hypothetical protein
MVDVLIDLRLTRFFFQSTANWPRSLDRVDAAYGRMKHRDAKPRKIWTDPESRTVPERKTLHTSESLRAPLYALCSFFLAPKLKAIGDALKFEPEAETEAEIPEYRMSEANIGVVTLSHKVVRLPMIMFMHTVGLVNSASQSAMEKKSISLYFDEIPCPFLDEIIFL